MRTVPQHAERMFIYHYRIFDRYKRPVAILAVLADSHKNWKPTSYGFTVLGCKLSVEFPVAKLTDYEERLDELLESDNAFGWITAAHILTKKNKKATSGTLRGKTPFGANTLSASLEQTTHH